jgi:pyruvate/2-oxoglutarate dehydrogenase complex dihydrolipoamide dehydrogenase (E3) component
MPVDYDLVIIGYTEAGIHAAQLAAQHRARVALVEQRCQPQLTRHRGLATLARSLYQVRSQGFLFKELAIPPALHWPIVNQWLDGIAQDQQPSPDLLAAAGVEWITGEGAFVTQPKLGLMVDGRLLRSRAYLLAPGHRLYIPDIDGLAATGYLTPEQVLHPPQSLIVISSSATGAELAQLYARLGCQVTLVSNQPTIVPGVDAEISLLLQAQLETEGVRVLTGKALQVRQIQGKKWVQVSNQAIEADEILLATGYQSNLDPLNLEAVPVVPLRVNARLQTQHSQIYWCGSADPAIAKHEAAIAVKNALFFPHRKANYLQVPQTAFTDPEIAWIGLTERDAISTFGQDVTVLKQSLRTLDKVRLGAELPGLCKMIVRRGEILGVHMLGSQASEVMGAVAIAMQQKVKLNKLTQIAAFSTSEIVQNLAFEWNAQQFQQKNRLQDMLEGFFAWRRSSHS